MRASTAKTAGRGSALVISSHPETGVRELSAAWHDLGRRELDDSATNNDPRGVRKAPQRRGDGRRAAVDAGGSTVGDVSSSFERALMAARDIASIAAALSRVRPLPRSASLAHLRGWRRLCQAQSRIGPESQGHLQRRGHRGQAAAQGRRDMGAPRTPTPAASWHESRRCPPPYSPLPRPMGSVEFPGRISREPGEATPKDRRRCSAASVPPCNLLPGVDAIERAPGRCGSCTRSTPRPAAFRNLPWRTHGPLLSEPASRRMGGCIQPRLRDVDEVGADCRQDVYGLGDDAVYSALRRSVAP
jgi:hypothetical protein